MAESIWDVILGENRFKKPQTGLMSSFDDTDYGNLTAKAEKDYLQGMKTRDKIALLTSAMPVVGGITGTYADAMNMIENPEERTLANAGLMALNWIPTGRGAREGMRMADDSYRVQHQVANPKDYPDESIRLDDLTKSITGEKAGYPADFYSDKGLLYYADYGDAHKESYDIIKSVRGNPDATVTIYRGVPKGVDKINEGDWVTLSPTYAREHASTGYGRLGDEAGEVISQEVKVKDIYWGGDDVNEFGYFPEPKGLLDTTIRNTDEFEKLASKGKMRQARTTKEDIQAVKDGDLQAIQVDVDNVNLADSYEKIDKKWEKFVKQFEDKGLIVDDDKYGNLTIGTKEGVEKLKQAENPYDYGNVFGYSEEDIARFYKQRAGGHTEIAMEEFIRDKQNHINRLKDNVKLNSKQGLLD